MNQPTKEINIAKNLTDVFAFIAAVLAFAAVIIAKKQFEPDEKKEILHFLDVPSTKEALKLGAVFLFSGIFSIATRWAPILGCAVSFLPFIFTVEALKAELLSFDQHPSVYIILAAVHFVGSLIYLGQWFTERPPKCFKNSLICYISGFLGTAAMITILLYKEIKGFTGFAVYVDPVFELLTVFSTLSGILGIVWFVRSDKRHMHTLWCSAAATVSAPLTVLVKTFLL